MPKPWSEVATSPAYQSLAPDEQAAAKQEYFATQVASRVPEAERGSAWQQFSTYEPPAKAGDASSRAMAAPLPETQGVGLAKGLAREATEGATFGWGDEVGLGAAAVAAKAAQEAGFAPNTGQSLGQIYGDMRSSYDDERQQFHDEHPIAATAANIAGGLATGGLGGAKAVGAITANAGKLARIGTTAAVGAAEGGLYGAGNADLGNRLQGAAQGATVGAVMAPVASAAAGSISRSLAKRGAVTDVERLTPTRDDLRDASQALYGKADQLGVVLKPQMVGQLQAGLMNQAKQLGFNARIHPKVAGALGSFDDLATDTPTLARLEQQRRILGAAGKSLEPDERRIASDLINHYDDAIQNLKATDVSAGNAMQAGKLLKDARALWQRQAKLGTIDDAVERAQNQASGFENGLRTQFRTILNNPKKMRGFTADERNALQQIVRGGPVENTLKFLGRFGFGEKGATNVVGAAIGSSAGYTAGGPVGAVVVPMLGQAARKGAQRATRRNVDKLQQLVAAGAHPRYIVNRYATLAGKKATPHELAQYLVTTPHGDLMDLAAKLNSLKGPRRQLATDALSMALSGQVAKESQGNDQ